MPEAALTYRDLEGRWKSLRAGGVRVREVACVGAPRTLLCAEIGAPELPCVHLCAGVHGDEPSGVLALLDMASSNAFDARFSYRIWPCTNPTGLDARTRRSIDGVDVNRTFGRGGSSPESKALLTANRDLKFVLAVDLHEDDEAGGFYAYEYGEPGIGARVIESMGRGGFALDPRGLLRPDPAEEAASLGGLSLSLLLCRNAAKQALTFETASSQALASRVDAHVAALTEALAALRLS